MTRWLQRFWLASLGAVIVQTFYYWMRLPDRIASHFDLQGNPDSWSSSNSFMVLWLFVIVVVNIWPIVGGPLLRKLPKELINAPNKDFWLSNDQRRDRLVAIIRAMMGGCIGGANVMLLIALYETYRFNMSGGGEVTIWLGLGIETVITIFSIVWGTRRLKNPEERSFTPS